MAWITSWTTALVANPAQADTDGDGEAMPAIYPEWRHRQDGVDDAVDNCPHSQSHSDGYG